MDGHRLWLKFTNGEEKVFDFTPLLDSLAFKPLEAVELFNSVYIEYGVPVWDDGAIDIAPEYLYEHSKAA